MKINLITLITLLVASLSAQAQNNDRVITITGDTIACQINLPVSVPLNTEHLKVRKLKK